jgi:hypothetical protein
VSEAEHWDSRWRILEKMLSSTYGTRPMPVIYKCSSVVSGSTLTDYGVGLDPVPHREPQKELYLSV